MAHQAAEELAERKYSMEVVAGGSAAEAIGGTAAVVLAILGLAGLLPAEMARVATIVVGAALLFEGGSLVSRFSKVLSETDGEILGTAEIGGGVTVELVGGLAGVVLGILALMGVVPMTLMSVAVIVFGAALLLATGTTSRLNALTYQGAGSQQTQTHHQLAREAVAAASGVQLLLGLGAITLGILALVGITPITLVLVGFLSVGASILFSGSAIAGRMIGILTGR
jgi:hypothetical protein